MDVVAVVRRDRPLPRPTQLPVHSVLPEALRLAAAERLRLPQLPKGKHTKSVVRDGVGSDFCLTRQTERVPTGCVTDLLSFLFHSPPALLSFSFLSVFFFPDM